MRRHIVFIGFMGSGKTCVSRRLARSLGVPLIDVDQRIEIEQGRTIKEIFAREGEEGFRAIETETLRELKQLEPCVISCGGGIVCNPANRPVLKELGCVVYLRVPLEESIRRISDPSTRPMLNGPRPVGEIYEERLPMYEECAEVIVETQGYTVSESAVLVEETLRERGEL